MMSTPIKYALAAGAGYALHAVLKRNKAESPKAYKPITDESLTAKVVNTVTSHLLEKFLWPDKASTSRSRYSYAPNFQGENK